MLDDYGALIRSGQAIVPDYAAQEAQRQVLALKKQELNARIEDAQRQLGQRQAFDQDIAKLLTNPTSEGYAAMIAKHPDFATQIKQSHEILDAGRRQSDLTQMSEIYASASNGRFDLAAKLMRRRVEADKAADGQADPSDENILAALESNDPTQQKAALGMMGLGLSAITGPDKFQSTLGALTEMNSPDLMPVGAGTVVIDKNDPSGGPVFESPYRPETIVDPATGQKFLLKPRAQEQSSPGTMAASPPTIGPISDLGARYGRVTSTKRTPEHNKNVGGVPGSHHVKGTAIDIARKPGVSHGQIEAAYKAAGYQLLESLDEGDHSHFAFGGANPAGPTRVRSKQEYDRLPSGAQYVAPDGSMRVKG